MAYITTNDFLARSGLASGDTNLVYLAWVLDAFSTQIDEMSKTQFSIQNKTKTIREFGQPTNQVFFGAWQATGLTITGQKFGDTTAKTYTENTDYYLEPVRNGESPIIKAVFPSLNFYKQDFITVSGQYGYSASLPTDLEMALYTATLTAVVYNRFLSEGANQTNGVLGLVKSERWLDQSKSYEIPTDFMAKASQLASGNIISLPAVFATLQTIKSKIYPSIKVI